MIAILFTIGVFCLRLFTLDTATLKRTHFIYPELQYITAICMGAFHPIWPSSRLNQVLTNGPLQSTQLYCLGYWAAERPALQTQREGVDMRSGRKESQSGEENHKVDRVEESKINEASEKFRKAGETCYCILCDIYSDWWHSLTGL